jgi:flavin-dependent dehydrogenase
VADPVFRVRHESGAEVHPGQTVTDAHGNAVTFLYATRATAPGKSGKVVVSDGFDGTSRREHEHYAHIYGLTVARVIRDHSDASGAWCPFSLVSSLSGECPVCD